MSLCCVNKPDLHRATHISPCWPERVHGTVQSAASPQGIHCGQRTAAEFILRQGQASAISPVCTALKSPHQDGVWIFSQADCMPNLSLQSILAAAQPVSLNAIFNVQGFFLSSWVTSCHLFYCLINTASFLCLYMLPSPLCATKVMLRIISVRQLQE